MKTIFVLLSLWGFPPCQTEDSNTCYWDAASRGNGIGQSYVVWDNEVYYLP